MELIGTILDGRHQMSPEQQRLERHYLATMKDGTVVRKKWTKAALPKTNQQVKTHFGLVIGQIRERMADLGWDICGVLPNKQMVHEILKKCCGGVGENGEVIGLSDMNIPQAMQFFDNCRTWASTQLAISIPDPDPEWYKKEHK